MGKSKYSPKISVIMVSYHTGPALLEAIDGVLRDPDISELILVDNGNPTERRTQLAQLTLAEPRIRLVQGHGNIGFGRGCNYGAALAGGDYFLFLNPDAIIEMGAAQALVSASEGLKVPWIMGARLVDENGVEQRGSRRNMLTPMTCLASFTGLDKLGLKSVYRHKEALPKGRVAMPVISGAAFMTDRASFARLDGFDERYFLHVEDVDLCRRAGLAGGDVCLLPVAMVRHYGASSDVSTLSIGREKIISFGRYFWNYSDKFLAKLFWLIGMPFLALAIGARSMLSTLQSND